jgi:hypothetical protein
MDTNLAPVVVCAAAKSSENMDFLTIIVCPRDPFWSLLLLVTIVACVTAAVLLLRNIITLFHRELPPPDCAAVQRRLTISGYLLVFLAVVCGYMAVTWIFFAIANMRTTGVGAAQLAMLEVNFMPCYHLALALLILTAMRCATGIAFEIRKRHQPF